MLEIYAFGACLPTSRTTVSGDLNANSGDTIGPRLSSGETTCRRETLRMYVVPWRVASRACRRKNKETRVRTPLNSHGHSFSEVAAKIELAGVLVRTWIQGKDNESKAIQVVSPNICLVGNSASCRSECAIRGVRFPEAFGILRYEGCGDREQQEDQSRFHTSGRVSGPGPKASPPFWDALL
jgi:hypothetical protein